MESCHTKPTNLLKMPSYSSGDVVKFKQGNVPLYGMIVCTVSSQDGFYHEILGSCGETLVVLEDQILCKMEEA